MMKLVLGIIWTFLCVAWIWIAKRDFERNSTKLSKALSITNVILSGTCAIAYYIQFFTA